MKKILLLATSFVLVTSVALADNSKKEKKKKAKVTCTKGGKCCSKDKSKCAKM